LYVALLAKRYPDNPESLETFTAYRCFNIK
jgi:hypothetical protein